MMIKVSSAQSAVRTAVAHALAEALICGIGNCAEEHHELSELQQIELATMTIMSYDNALETCETLAFEAELDQRFKS